MRFQRSVSLVLLTLFAFPSVLLAQGAKSPGTLVHRTATSRPDLTGIWQESSASVFELQWSDSRGQPLKTLPMTPWAEEKFRTNRPIGPYTSLNSNDPRVNCLPPGVPGIYTNAFPMEIFQIPGRVMMLFEYDHYVRQIFTDRRDHPKDVNPTWMGDSIGKWQGDTLVVDSVGFNDRTWLDVHGHPHSEALHVVERIRRVDHNTLMIEITLDDPKAYTTPLRTQRKLILKPAWNIMEFICEDNMVNFLDYEKKTGSQDNQAAEAAAQPQSSQSIKGSWSGAMTPPENTSVGVTAFFLSESSGVITVTDPTRFTQYRLQNLAVAADGTVTGSTADGVNLLVKLSADGKHLAGDLVLASGTGYRISLSRP
jgi:hypothetical protein